MVDLLTTVWLTGAEWSRCWTGFEVMLADSGKLTPGSNWSMDIKEYSGLYIFQAVSYAIIGVTLRSTGMNLKFSGMETVFLARICFRQHFS